MKTYLIAWLFALVCSNCLAQAPESPTPETQTAPAQTGENPPAPAPAQATASVSAPAVAPAVTQPPAPESESSEVQAIIVKPGPTKPPAFLYAASTQSQMQVSPGSIEQTIQVQVRVVQGQPGTVSIGLAGTGEVIDVQGEAIASWSVRKTHAERFIDLQFPPEIVAAAIEKPITIRLRSSHGSLPTTVEPAYLTPGKALGFDSQIDIHYLQGVSGKIVEAEGFAPLVSKDRTDRLQTAKGGRLALRLDRQSTVAPMVELLDTSLEGTLHASGKSIDFQLRGTAAVREAGARIQVLGGNVAISELPQSDDFHLELRSTEGGPRFDLVFLKPGRFPLSIHFSAGLKSTADNRQSLDFYVASGAVVPMRLNGLEADLEFERGQQAVVPMLVDKTWQGFLPASGNVHMLWQSSRNNTAESKPFFTTSAVVETSVGPGLLRQEHRIDYQMLQGQIRTLNIAMIGPGELISVEGEHIVTWKVVGEGDKRQLEIALNQPLTGKYQVRIRTQTALGEFPAKVEVLSLQPQGAIRSSGHLRISNAGSVSFEPTGLRGLTQLSIDQFPGEAIQARQVMVYRFPSAEYAATIAADRVQPEVNVSQLMLYQLTETDRVILADIELDIREAPVREWSMRVPDDYSIVSVTGAAVADYQASTESNGGQRNLKVLFGQDVQGRQLISLRLEKNQAAQSGSWQLPRLEFPDAESVRGDVGVTVAAGFRATVESAELLVEKPLSYFPKPIADLQQAFRIREPGWSAVLKIEQLDRSIQTDMFHLYSLSQGVVYGSALINYSITGAPVAELKVSVPEQLANLTVDGRDIRTWRRDGATLIVSLQRPILGSYTLLLTFEEKPNASDGSFQAGLVAPIDVQEDRGYIEVVSPVQVEMRSQLVSNQLLVLDPLELPAELRLLSTAPALGTWQYTQRPFELRLAVKWFDPGTTTAQVVEFAEANSRVSPDGELVTDLLYYVKSRGQRTLKVRLPAEPVKLWAASVNGRPVTARQAGDDTLIPLPGEADPNTSIEVSLRLGKPASDAGSAALELPTVFSPVLKTQWNINGDENHVLIPNGGNVEPTVPVRYPNGLDQLLQSRLMFLIALVVLVLVAVLIEWRPLKIMVNCLALFTAFIGGIESLTHLTFRQPLRVDLPVLSAGETATMEVANIPTWQALFWWPGVVMAVVGASVLVVALRNANRLLSLVAFGAMVVGVLLQTNGAILFWVVCAAAIAVCQLWPLLKGVFVDLKNKVPSGNPQETPPGEGTPSGTGLVTSLLLGALILSGSARSTQADDKPPRDGSVVQNTTIEVTDAAGIQAADSLIQKWDLSIRKSRLTANAECKVTGMPGDRFLILQAPGVLTKFDGPGLRLNKAKLPGDVVGYIVTIIDEEASGDAKAEDKTNGGIAPLRARQYSAAFEYQVESIDSSAGIPVLTGRAALQRVELTYDEPDREVLCDAATQIEIAAPAGKDSAKATILLGPGAGSIALRPRSRDMTTEATQLFVEGAGVYIPGPGVVNGKYRLNIRASQGRVHTLNVIIPVGDTVSSVEGPVSNWQFDADKNRMLVNIKPDAPSEFALIIDTQRSLDALPTRVQLTPVRVEGVDGEVGLLALAFGTEAQPDATDVEGLSQVSIEDFDRSLIGNLPVTLHRVYRYGKEPGSVTLQVSPVAPEVRVQNKLVVSLGDERIVVGITMVAEITRTGLFQLSFPLPTGLEVESISGEALHHWSELTDEAGKRQIVLHLKSKTIGPQKFSITLAGAAPADPQTWDLPRFEMNEATRQSGELVVQPMTGLRLRAATRQNVTEVDPRALGAEGQGALAFRLLQREWNLQLAVERLEPWVTGQVLHEVTLREGQTRSLILADFNVQNAAIRSLQVKLPITVPEELNTVRATGEVVGDFVRSADEPGVWELRLKRRVIGPLRFQIEYERRDPRSGDIESLVPIEFPKSRQVGYYYSVRAGGRLEVEAGTLTQGWQRIDWGTVPQPLRETGNRNAPALTLRAASTTTPLPLKVIRHSLAESLKLRVASGTITTILSPTGDQLTAVDVNMEVIQRSSLSIELPAGSELFSIFVNGESVHSIRQKVDNNIWQFYILPGMDDRTAQVRFVYSVTGDSLSRLNLVSPQLNVPLENIEWSVIAPREFEMTHHDGSLELVGDTQLAEYDRNSYLSGLKGKRQDQAKQAANLLQQANQLLQEGQRSKAEWAFNNVANRYALDAASNEDARVQLENLQTQQAIVGLNTRRHRLLLDASHADRAAGENEQLRQAAVANPILQQEQLNYRPQEMAQLLAGNSQEDNAILQQIAGRIVLHQRTTEPAPQAIVISLPEEGTVYRFRRSVQVSENAALQLQLQFASRYKLRNWQIAVLGTLLVGLAIGITRRPVRKR